MTRLLRTLTCSLCLFLCEVGWVSCNKCTNVLSRDKVQEVVVKHPCVQSYTARCGWLSLNYCTFYTNTYCDKRVNETIKLYYVVTDCCKGYMLAADGTCIKKQPGMVYASTPKTPPSSVNPDYQHVPIRQSNSETVKNTEISGGVYAGIGCGLVLVASVIIFIVIAVRKRKRKKMPKNESAEHRQYAPVSPSHHSIITTTYNSGNGSVQLARETTSPALRMATPPTSPVKTILVQQPMLNENIDMNNIPESDI